MLAATQYINTRGGFLSPPDDADMQMVLQCGLCVVFQQGGEVLGFNRYVTHPEMVQQAFMAEFQLDASKDYSDRNSLVHWSGSKKLKDNKTLRCVHWVDRQQALIALQAAQAGLQNKATGKLAWAIDSAVSPGHQHQGISKSLIRHGRAALMPGIGFSASRIFKIVKINHKKINMDNNPSKKAFIKTPSRFFAYTEEDIQINTGVHITVRWNHWLNHYQQ